MLSADNNYLDLGYSGCHKNLKTLFGLAYAQSIANWRKIAQDSWRSLRRNDESMYWTFQLYFGRSNQNRFNGWCPEWMGSLKKTCDLSDCSNCRADICKSLFQHLLSMRRSLKWCIHIIATIGEIFIQRSHRYKWPQLSQLNNKKLKPAWQTDVQREWNDSFERGGHARHAPLHAPHPTLRRKYFMCLPRRLQSWTT